MDLNELESVLYDVACILKDLGIDHERKDTAVLAAINEYLIRWNGSADDAIALAIMDRIKRRMTGNLHNR